MAILEAHFRKDGEEIEQSASSSIFSVHPTTVIRGLEPDSRYLIRLVLTDPYGNRTDLSRQFGDLTVDTDSIEEERPVWRQIQKKHKGWVIRQNPSAGKLLKDELADLRSYRVKKYRIIYRVFDQNKILEIVAIGPRKRIYEKTFHIISKEIADTITLGEESS